MENGSGNERHRNIIEAEIIRVVSSAELEDGAGGGGRNHKLHVGVAEDTQVGLIEKGGSIPRDRELVRLRGVVELAWVDEPKRQQVVPAGNGRQVLAQVGRAAGLAQERGVVARVNIVRANVVSNDMAVRSRSGVQRHCVAHEIIRAAAAAGQAPTGKITRLESAVLDQLRPHQDQVELAALPHAITGIGEPDIGGVNPRGQGVGDGHLEAHRHIGEAAGGECAAGGGIAQPGGRAGQRPVERGRPGISQQEIL